MGNCASCYVPTPNTNETACVVMDPKGNPRQVNVPVKAAELMMEQLNMFIAHAEELLRTKRVVPMKADDELFPGQLYLLVSSSRLNCKLSKQELQFILSANLGCENYNKKWKKGTRVLPDVAAVEQDKGGKMVSEFRDYPRRSSSTGSSGHWIPVLETIME